MNGGSQEIYDWLDINHVVGSLDFRISVDNADVETVTYAIERRAAGDDGGDPTHRVVVDRADFLAMLKLAVLISDKPCD